MSTHPLHPVTDPDQLVRLRRFRQMGDPLADAAVADMLRMPPEGRSILDLALRNGIDSVPNAPESWRALFRQLDHVPYWVDWNAHTDASAAFLRAGALGILSLGCYVMPQFYSLAAGNKALEYSGDLHKRAARRGRETARFTIETCLPGNLRRDADGFSITVRVRIVHAHARAMILRSGTWDSTKCGVPISQSYMAAMNLLLSVGWIDGLRRVGFHFSRHEEECVMQLWRYSAWLIGIDPELQLATCAEGRHLWQQLLHDEPPPDDGSRALVDALFQAIPEVFELKGKSHQRVYDFFRGLASSMLPRPLVEQLHLPRSVWGYSRPLAVAGVPMLTFLERRVPYLQEWSRHLGARLWLSQAEYAENGGLEMFAPRHKPEHPSSHNDDNSRNDGPA